MEFNNTVEQKHHEYDDDFIEDDNEEEFFKYAEDIDPGLMPSLDRTRSE